MFEKSPIYFSEEGFHNIFTRFFPWGEESYHGQLTLWIFYFCLVNIIKSKWTFREHLFLLPLSLLTSGRLRLGWPHFWSEYFLSDPSPIIALSCQSLSHSTSTYLCIHNNAFQPKPDIFYRTQVRSLPCLVSH